MARIRKITDENYEKFIGEKDGRVKALKFEADWCHWCKELSKILPEIIRETPEIDWGKTDTEKNKEVAREYSVTALPMILFFKDGKKLKPEIDGFSSAEYIIRYIKRKVLR